MKNVDKFTDIPNKAEKSGGGYSTGDKQSVKNTTNNLPITLGNKGGF